MSSLTSADFTAVAQLVFAGIVAVATVIYVFYTARMWREMRLTNRRLEDPNVIAIIEPGRSWGGLIEFSLKNIGNIPVMNLRVGFEPATLPFLAPGAPSFVKRPIPVMLPGHEIRTRIFTFEKLVEALGTDNLRIVTTLTYVSPAGATFSQSYEYDIGIYLGLTDFRQKTLSDVVERLEKTNTHLEKISTHLNDLGERMDWRFQHDWSYVRDPVPLAQLLRMFDAAWLDFKRDNRYPFFFPARLRLLSLLTALYDTISARLPAGDTEEIRGKLLAMIERQFYIDGGMSAQAFVADGDALAALLTGIREPWSKAEGKDRDMPSATTTDDRVKHGLPDDGCDCSGGTGDST